MKKNDNKKEINDLLFFDSDSFLNYMSDEFKKKIEIFIFNLKSIRGNMVLPEVISNIFINNGKKIREISSVRSELGKIVIKPFEKKNFSSIKSAVLSSKLGYIIDENNISSNDELFFRLSPMTEEIKNNLIKKIKEKKEEAMIGIKLIRQKNINKIGKNMSNNQKFNLLNKIDNLFKEYQKKIIHLEEQKKNEIKK